MCLKREQAPSTRHFFVAQLIFNAVFEKDVGCINEIAKRIDGAVPDADERDQFANILGDALDDVMDFPLQDLVVYVDDPAIVAIAKALIYIALEPVGKSVSKRKDREKALGIVLSRIGGNKNKPVRETELLEYVEPEWLTGLPETAPTEVNTKE